MSGFFGDGDRARLIRIEGMLTKILATLQDVQRKEQLIMATAQEVLTAVQEETTVEQSVITLLDQISTLLQAAKQDPAVLDQVVALIATNKQAMADAVTRNTPAAPTA